MMFDLMSEEDLACLREFIDAGNGEAMYEYASDHEYVFESADEYIAMLEKSVEAGYHLAAEELAYIFENGKSASFSGKEFSVPINEDKARKFNELATILKKHWENANEGRILVCDFYGWLQLRCGKNNFDASYLFPYFPCDILQMCIESLDNGTFMSEWFSDENHGHNISEELVEGTPHLFIRWQDDEKVDQCAEFPRYTPKAFAKQIADDIEANYFGFAYFMTSCDGGGLKDAVEKLKQGVSRLRVLLGSKKQLNNDEGGILT